MPDKRFYTERNYREQRIFCACGAATDNVMFSSMCKQYFRQALIVCKTGHAAAAAMGVDVAQWLQLREYGVTVVTADRDGAMYAEPNLGLVVVLGGDGTILGVARRLIGRKIPIFGINFGRIGYLTTSQPGEWRERLADCVAGRLQELSCMTLQWGLRREKKIIASGVAVNDVVLSRGSLSRLLTLNIRLEGRNAGDVRSDGLIVCTPVGSSGYNASAGGPLLAPTMEMLLLTPICPLLRATQPVVLPGNIVCELTFPHGSTDCYMTVDGQEGQMLQHDDVVTLTGVPDGMRLICSHHTFLEQLWRSQCA